MIKIIYKILPVIIILNDEKLEVFPLKSETNQGSAYEVKEASVKRLKLYDSNSMTSEKSRTMETVKGCIVARMWREERDEQGE